MKIYANNQQEWDEKIALFKELLGTQYWVNVRVDTNAMYVSGAWFINICDLDDICCRSFMFRGRWDTMSEIAYPRYEYLSSIHIIEPITLYTTEDLFADWGNYSDEEVQYIIDKIDDYAKRH